VKGPHEASVYIQQDGKKFKIQSDQLQQIGEQLRGRPHFSVFNSIIIPLTVTILTLLATSGSSGLAGSTR
jgi:hypothetical protein